jgi:rhodanese-related sulfurtransferase
MRCPFIPVSSGETDSPDIERERSRLSGGDHQPDLADACGVERRGARLTILCYCNAYNRGALSADTLRVMGYRNARFIAGGLKAYRALD